jgi:hypothetical protein
LDDGINFVIMAGMQIDSERHRKSRLVLGRTDGVNCVVYSVLWDDCGLNLFHEICHNFKLAHIETALGDCAPLGKYNVMAVSVDARFCKDLAFDQISTGSKCQAPLNFERSPFSRRFRSAVYDLAALNALAPFDAVGFLRHLNSEPFTHAIFGNSSRVHIAGSMYGEQAALKKSGQAAACSLSDWSGPVAISHTNAPYTVRARTRACVCRDHFGECENDGAPLFKFDVFVNSNFAEAYDPFRLAAPRHDKTRDCTTQNGCAYACNHDTKILLQSGASCTFNDRDGVCVKGTCVALDMLETRDGAEDLSRAINAQHELAEFAAAGNLLIKCSFQNAFVRDLELETTVRDLFPMARRSLVPWICRGQRDHSVDVRGHANCLRFENFLRENGRMRPDTTIKVRFLRNMYIQHDMSDCWLHGSRNSTRERLNAYTCSKYVQEYRII